MQEQERLNDIEIKLARQDDLLETLNTMVYQQQKKISELEALCAALARHVKASSADHDGGTGNDRPPHY